jgi:elongation factor Ts
MAVSADSVKALRDKTGVSVMECKKALEEAAGDMDKALLILSARAAASVGKKADRTLAAGSVASYVHSTKQMGAIIVLACETDFVAKGEEFNQLAYDIAMHAAAMRPETAEELVVQPYIKDPSKTIADLLAGATQKFGERIEVSKMAFFSVA